MPREIITLQLGNFSNYVGAHYWNLQDEVQGYSSREQWADYAAGVDQDVLYMSQEDRQGELSYRPRMVAVDLGGSLGGVSFSTDATASAASAAAAATWSGRCEVHRAAPVPKSAFVEQLEEQEHAGEHTEDAEYEQQQAALEHAARTLDTSGVRYWTDYCKALLHPKSVYTLPGLWAGVNDLSGFGDAGEALAHGGSAEALEEVLDRLRYFGEACDSLQGFQVLSDDLTGFGGMGAALLSEVVQEYAGRPLLLFSMRPRLRAPPGGTTASARAAVSEGLAMARGAELASLYVPMAAPQQPGALPYLRLDPALPFQSSALLAMAVDSTLLPARLTGAASPLGPSLGGYSLQALVQLLQGPRGGSAKLAAACLALPAAALPADMRQLEAQLDPRMHLRHPHAGTAGAAVAKAMAEAAAAAGAAGKPPELAAFSRSAVAGSLQGRAATLELQGQLAGLTPGLDDLPEDCLAESIVLRGARTAGGPATTSYAQQTLDAMLMRAPRRRCVQHRCIAAMPAPIPLPFPSSLFAPCVSAHGDVLAAGAARAADEGVATVPVLAKLVASRGFREVVSGVHVRWRQATASAAGASVLSAWDLGAGDVDEVSEHLMALSASYAEEEED